MTGKRGIWPCRKAHLGVMKMADADLIYYLCLLETTHRIDVRRVSRILIHNLYPTSTSMKSFIKQVLASGCAIIIVLGIIFIGCMFAFVSLISAYSESKQMGDTNVLVVQLGGFLDERSSDYSPMQYITGDKESSTIGLDDILEAIRKAKESDNIKGIYISAGALSPDSYASLMAIRHALLDFRESGKWVVSYADVYTQGAYYVCSAADKVLLNPSGMIDWHGLTAQTMYVKDLLAKIGVKVQLSKVGKYKSAPDMFTAEKMSDADREQITAYVNCIWNNICNDVSASRNIAVSDLNAMADSLVTLTDPSEYIRLGMADKLVYARDVKEEIRQIMNLDRADDIATIGVAGINDFEIGNNRGREIAVYYAYGDIVTSESESLTAGDEGIICSKTVCADLEKLASDDDISAIVLRVNSGGGSAYASEQIYNTIAEVRKSKPVVVSMGGMAASGGYYISSNANWIVAEPVTLTGSIGIFGMFPDVSGLVTDKLGIKFDYVKTNKHSDFGAIDRPLNSDEMAHINSYIDRGYQLFVSRVAQGRGISEAEVNEIAQGRVWTGEDALAVKLVDQLGGIDEAVAKAAEMAEVDNYHTVSYPSKESWLDWLLAPDSGDDYIETHVREALGDCYLPLTLMNNARNGDAIQARLPYYINVR